MIKKIFVILFVGYMGYIFYNFATAETRVKSLCVQLRPSMTLQQLNAFGAQHDLYPKINTQSGIHFMVEKKTFGRFGCEVLLEAGAVKSAEYNFAD